MNRALTLAAAGATGVAALIALGASAAGASTPTPTATWNVKNGALSLTVSNPTAGPYVFGEAHGDMANALGVVPAGATATFNVAAALNPGTYKVYVNGTVNGVSVEAVENVTSVVIPGTPPATSAPKPAPVPQVKVTSTTAKSAAAPTPTVDPISPTDPVVGWFGFFG